LAENYFVKVLIPFIGVRGVQKNYGQNKRTIPCRLSMKLEKTRAKKPNASSPAGSETPAGIYIHIPFCIQKCRYCDFYSVTDLRLAPAFIHALITEITGHSKAVRSVDSLYIGGGTPSVLPAAYLSKLIDTVAATFSLLPDTEITIEVNPGTVTLAQLRAYRRAGVNRLNIGVQSFQEETLKFLGRCHTASDAGRAIDWSHVSGFDNFGLDLIYGIPDQTTDLWHEDIARALHFKPAHLSCYMLSFEPGTPLEKSRADGAVHPMPDGRVSDLFLFTDQTLTRAGYEHYEISNFSLGKVYRSRHNRKYWAHSPYLGFGPAAHSFLPPVRRWNVKNVPDYIERLSNGKSPESESETLSREQLMIEAIYLGLRQSDGIDLAGFETRFDARFTALFSPVLAELLGEGVLSIRENRCTLTRNGMLYLDAIAGRFADRVV
jgi:oxygen-independent coproporphyrinogen III oxidase